MIVYILCFLILPPVRGANISNVANLTSFAKDVINSTFPSFRFLVYISEDDCYMAQFVNDALVQLNMKLLRVSINAMNIGTIEKYTAGTAGYVIASTELEPVADLFSARFTFKPHVPVLIFYQSEETLYREPFLNAVNLKGIRIIYIHVAKSGITVSFLQNNKTLLTWDGEANSDYRMNPKEFQLDLWKPNFTYDGTRRSFRVSTFNCSPYVLYSPDKSVYDGVEYHYIKFATRNWPVQYLIPNTPGDLWTVLVDDVIDGRSDLAACTIWTDALWNRNLTMSYPYLTICATFLVSRPKMIQFASYVTNAIAPNLWLLTVAAIISVAASLVFVAKVTKQPKYANFSFSLLQTIRVLSISCLEKYPPPSYSTLRVVLTAWSATCLLLATAFSAGYASSLSSPRHSAPIKTLKDMIERDIKIDKWEPVLSMFKTSYNEDMRTLAKNFVENMTDKDAVLESGRYATFVKTVLSGYVTNTENFTEKQRRQVTLMPECFGNYYVHFAMAKDSPFEKVFNVYYSRVTSAGLHEHLAKSVITPGEAKYMRDFFLPHVADKLYSPLNMEKVQGVFVFLLSGYAIAMLAFAGELLYYNYCKLNHNIYIH